MSKEKINLDLTLATPDYIQPPSLPESTQESGDNLRLPSPAVQESPDYGRQFQFPSPAVQESPLGYQFQFPSPAVQESPHGRQFQFPSPAVQESPLGPQFQFPSPAVQESPHGGLSQLLSPAVQESVYRPHRQFQFLSPAVQETLHGRQSQLLSPAVQESVNYRRHRQLQFPSPSVQEFHRRRELQRLEQAEREAIFRSLYESLPSPVQRALQLPSPAVQEPHSLLPPPPLTQQLLPQETRAEQEITTLHPWEKSPAKLHTLDYLRSKNINMISGEIICKSCKTKKSLEYNVREKLEEVCKYLKESVKQLGQRVSNEWLKPELGECGVCKHGTKLKPVISEKTEEINWLFLMLGQMLGFCNVNQLTYFCEQNSQPTNYNKACLLYIVYVVICKQLDPTLDFDLRTF